MNAFLLKQSSALGSIIGGLGGAGIGALTGLGAETALEGVDLPGVEKSVTDVTGLQPAVPLQDIHSALKGHGAMIGGVIGGLHGAGQGSKLATKDIQMDNEFWATEYFKLAALGLVRPLPANMHATPGANVNPMAGNALKVRTRPNIKPQMSADSSASLQAVPIAPGVPAKMAEAFAFFCH